jgi:hypothetical protein
MRRPRLLAFDLVRLILVIMAELDVVRPVYKDEVQPNDKGQLPRRIFRAEMKKSPATRRYS